MDRRSWLWRRKSSEKSPGETESSGSASSHSERYSDDQEAVKGSSNNASPNHAQSPEVSSNIGDSEVHESVKSLTEKLSVALLNISAKEELVKQHVKVAEEAVSGWEQAETEVAALKQQLEAANQKNSALEERIGHLDGALKECVRQLRQAREEQEEKVHDAVIKKTHQWESEKLELAKQLVELKAQLQAAKSEAAAAVDLGLKAKLEASEKENAAFKVELLSQSEDLQTLTLERELSNQAAETASKQHLESIKKVAKLEAECRRLRSRASKSLPVNGHKPFANSICMESVTDSQSDSGERLLSMDNEPGCSDSWASALIAELDQFKNDKASARNLITSIEIDLMDDFLEMERLVALPEADRVSSSFELEADSDRVATRESPLKVEALHLQLAELEEKVAKMENEKTELEMALVDSRNQLEASCNQLRVAEDKLIELQKQLDLANESKQVATAEVVSVEAKRKALEAQLESTELEVRKLYDKVCLLEGKIEGEKALSTELEARVEAAEASRKVSESQLKSAHLEVGSLHEMVGLLESKVAEERASSTEFAAKVQALEAVRMALDSQLESAHLEVNKLREKVGYLEVKAEEERTKSAEFATKVEAVEAVRKSSEFQLETANLEIGKLHDKVGLLEGQVSKEKALTAEFAAKCQKLESEISRIKREAELWQVTSSNGDLKIKQEKELAVAAGKLAECQKTIASLGQQLKSLTTLDDFMLEAEKLELNGGSPDLILHSSYSSEKISSYTFPNGKEGGSPPSSSLSSSSSTLSGFASLLPRSRSSSYIEN
ncbi:filament-like plant protein 3 [Phoenix dactylifera]|uniref:Filament-like plant protein 3 n=1 Tax=Phoenix dactylifera TaxID=42345 RepID=A0A8B7BS14_PHODC|nr:filament-like plant protein 3 [Phoenix dactylifera]XP_008784207.2 filament-like plant protein 3 [Phoenix dactylifera]XP_008784208.2 filament-like plant protein 3 [Phoenix dactylifera]XP_038986631.1 filament-like plant protein 3 [Phoenix dactylifera]